MKKQLTLIGMLLISGISFTQTDRLWSEGSKKNFIRNLCKQKPASAIPKVYNTDINGLKNMLAKAPKRLAAGEKIRTHHLFFRILKAEWKILKVRENSNLP